MSRQWRFMLITAITCGAIVVLGFMAWLTLNLRAVDHDSTDVVSYVLNKGTSAPEVGEELDQKGLIRSKSAFIIYVTARGLRSKLQAGTYEVSPSNSTREIAHIISDGKVAANRMVVPDGITIVKFRQIAEQRGVDRSDLDAALTASYSNDFLQARPAGATLEGYLYPDSYELMKPIRAKALIQSMLDNFAKRVGATDIAQRYVAEGLTLHQGVTLASIVEKEVGNDQDRAMVAQVYLNRLKAGMPLQADPTVLYVAETTGTSFNLNSTSAYNTYNHKGLPPGPICNPSLSSMKAVAHPTPNDYLYFIADKQGKTHYAKTFAEHQKNVDTYLK